LSPDSLLAGIVACASSQGQTTKAQTLKDAYRGLFRVGVALNPAEYEERDAPADAIIAAQFNAISPENAH
jgi:hypothetical protein